MTQAFTVYFDGACPLCAREVSFYQRQAGAQNIAWVDASGSPDGALGTDLDACDALKRFHVRDETGRLFSGARAFAKLWAKLDRFRVIGVVAQRPPIVWVLEGLYRFFLPLRPGVQGVFRRLAKSSPAVVED